MARNNSDAPAFETQVDDLTTVIAGIHPGGVNGTANQHAPGDHEGERDSHLGGDEERAQPAACGGKSSAADRREKRGARTFEGGCEPKQDTRERLT